MALDMCGVTHIWCYGKERYDYKAILDVWGETCLG